MNDLPLLETLYDALRSRCGIVVRTEDADFLRQKLYPMRKERMVEEPDFKNLSFNLSPTNPKTELWILRARPNNEKE